VAPKINGKALTPSDISRFSEKNCCQIEKKFAVTLSLKIPPHFKFVATLPCEMSQRFVDREIGQWRHRLECIVQQQNGHTEHFDVKTAGRNSYGKQ